MAVASFGGSGGLRYAVGERIEHHLSKYADVALILIVVSATATS